jgi:hypothetical protein
MQNPTDQAEASMPTETTLTNNDNGPDWNRPVKVRRKAAKRTLPFDLTVDELDLVSPPQAEDIPVRKKPRLEKPLPTTTTDAATQETASPDVSEGLNPPTAENIDANVDPLTDTLPNAGATRATRRWTLEEDAKLTRAVANTCKKKWGKDYVPNWFAISELIPGRTKNQCRQRWKEGLDPRIALTGGSKVSWTAVEDSKMKDAVQTHGGKNWVAIASLVPRRTQIQCNNRWHHFLDPGIVLEAGRDGKWEEDEDSKLKDAVHAHGGKDWVAICALVPGRTRTQCNHRWHNTLDPSIGRANGRNGKWSAVEDSQLKHAFQTHADMDWVAISALVPGRTRKQC